jgi:hypothetical protein
VVGMERSVHFDSHDIFLLDEYESFDMRELVRQCGVMDFKYSPERWIGDFKNNAADRFIFEMNKENNPPDTQGQQNARRFSITPTTMLEMENFYSYILPQIKQLSQHSQLFLKDGKVADYLLSIKEDEIVELQFGDYPAIEALAFAVFEMRRYVEIQERIPVEPPKEEHIHICLRGFGNRKERNLPSVRNCD